MHKLPKLHNNSKHSTVFLKKMEHAFNFLSFFVTYPIPTLPHAQTQIKATHPKIGVRGNRSLHLLLPLQRPTQLGYPLRDNMFPLIHSRFLQLTVSNKQEHYDANRLMKTFSCKLFAKGAM